MGKGYMLHFNVHVDESSFNFSLEEGVLYLVNVVVKLYM